MENNQENVSVQEKETATEENTKFFKLKQWVRNNKKKTIFFAICLVLAVVLLITYAVDSSKQMAEFEAAIDEIGDDLSVLYAEDESAQYAMVYAIERAQSKAYGWSDFRIKRARNYSHFEKAVKELDIKTKLNRLIEFLEEDMISDAERSIRWKLKQPDSYERSSAFADIYEYQGKLYGCVTVSYSATNSFGGRVYDSATEYYVYDGGFKDIPDSATVLNVGLTSHLSESISYNTAKENGTRVDCIRIEK